MDTLLIDTIILLASSIYYIYRGRCDCYILSSRFIYVISFSRRLKVDECVFFRRTVAAGLC